MKNITAVMFLFFVLPLHSTILTRNTFERYEGDTPQECGWDTSNSVNGVIEILEEDTITYQTQAHGRYGMRIKDPDNSSYANASKTFTNSASEYMIEFYVWIYEIHEFIDSFPLCVLYRHTVRPPVKTDISLYLNEVIMPAENIYNISLDDANGLHANVATIDSTNRWYKIQIYRHDGVVDFYLDGTFIDTYTPMNSNHVSTKISLGTTSANPSADGEVFYDDVLITDSKTQMAQMKEMSTQIQQKITATKTRDFNYYFTMDDIFNLQNLIDFLNSNFTDLSNYERLSYFNELMVMFDQIKLGLDLVD